MLAREGILISCMKPLSDKKEVLINRSSFPMPKLFLGLVIRCVNDVAGLTKGFWRYWDFVS